MYAFAIVVAIVSSVVLMAAVIGVVIGLADGEFAWAAGIAVVAVLAATGAWWGFSTTIDIERHQCESAGFEWITGSCYGVNVNVNG